MKFCKAFVRNIFRLSQQNFAHVTTVTLSWCVQNFVVIGWAHFKPKHCELWLNLLGWGARSHWPVEKCNMITEMLSEITDGQEDESDFIIAVPVECWWQSSVRSPLTRTCASILIGQYGTYKQSHHWWQSRFLQCYQWWKFGIKKILCCPCQQLVFWKPVAGTKNRVVMIPTLLSLVVPQGVIRLMQERRDSSALAMELHLSCINLMTTSATSANKVGIMTNLSFQHQQLVSVPTRYDMMLFMMLISIRCHHSNMQSAAISLL